MAIRPSTPSTSRTATSTHSRSMLPTAKRMLTRKVATTRQPLVPGKRVITRVQAPSLILIMQPMRVITRPKPTITVAILTKMVLTIRIMNQNLRVTDTVKATRTETVSMVLTKATAPTRKALVMNTETMEAITTNPLPNEIFQTRETTILTKGKGKCPYRFSNPTTPVKASSVSLKSQRNIKYKINQDLGSLINDTTTCITSSIILGERQSCPITRVGRMTYKRARLCRDYSRIERVSVNQHTCNCV
ncbi:uncharacterized protein LOC102678857 isoform X2 [Apis dorsata]|nr:uncharacterized protein LOC102678857 isoform X2 [Apis dorsata]